MSDIIQQSLPEAGRCGKLIDVGQRMQTFSYKMIKFGRSNVQHDDYTVVSNTGCIFENC